MTRFLRSQSKKPRNPARSAHTFADLEAVWEDPYQNFASVQPIAAHCTDAGILFDYAYLPGCVVVHHG